MIGVVDGPCQMQPTRLRRSVVIVVALAISVVSAIPTTGVSTSVDKPDEVIAAQHDPILVRTDIMLVLPELISGNGVRSGTGTAIDPYIIEDWYIRYEKGQPAIWLIDTTAHVVIQNITFADEWANAGGFAAVQLTNAENVVVENIGWRGELAAGLTDSRNIVLRKLRIPEGTALGDIPPAGGSMSLSNSDDVSINNVTLSGRLAAIDIWQGDVFLDDVRVERTGPAMGRDPPPHIYLGRGEAEPHPTCEVNIRNTTLSFEAENEFASDEDAGILIENECSATMRNLRVTGTEAGIISTDGSSIDVQGADLEPYYRPTSVSDPTPRPIYDAPIGIGAYGSSARLSDIDITGFPTGIGIHAASAAPPSEWSDAGGDGGPPSIRATEISLRSIGIGIEVTATCDPCTIWDGEILDNPDGNVINTGSSTVDARNNWWGSPDGPAPGSIEGDVLVEPWKTEGTDPSGDDATALVVLPQAGLLAVAALAASALALHWHRRRDIP